MPACPKLCGKSFYQTALSVLAVANRQFANGLQQGLKSALIGQGPRLEQFLHLGSSILLKQVHQPLQLVD